MKFGVCTGNDNIALAAEYGFDYIEANFKNIAMCSDDEFSNFLSLLKKNNIACETANCFLPGEIKVVGENVNYNAISEYLTVGYKRAAQAGIKVVVFGSGGARHIPEGYSYKNGIKDIIKFVREYAAPMAALYLVVDGDEQLITTQY